MVSKTVFSMSSIGPGQAEDQQAQDHHLATHAQVVQGGPAPEPPVVGDAKSRIADHRHPAQAIDQAVRRRNSGVLAQGGEPVVGCERPALIAAEGGIWESPCCALKRQARLLAGPEGTSASTAAHGRPMRPPNRITPNGRTRQRGRSTIDCHRCVPVLMMDQSEERARFFR